MIPVAPNMTTMPLHQFRPLVMSSSWDEPKSGRPTYSDLLASIQRGAFLARDRLPKPAQGFREELKIRMAESPLCRMRLARCRKRVLETRPRSVVMALLVGPTPFR